jgi:carboxylesterase type B
MKIPGLQNGRIAAASVVFATLAFVSGVRAIVLEPVKTDAGPLSGTSAAAPGVRLFKGIPFAAPPVGALRWRAPQPVAKWTGVRNADTFGNVCIQPKGVGRLNISVDLPDSPAASEDCLYLNIWTAARSASERQPVMFWIFGGAYAPNARHLKATHAVDIPYVFDNLPAPRVFPDPSSPELASASATDRAFAERVSSYWVNFAPERRPERQRPAAVASLW